jgi:hypothetical protein
MGVRSLPARTLYPLALLLPACFVYDEQLAARAMLDGASATASEDRTVADAGGMMAPQTAANPLTWDTAATGAAGSDIYRTEAAAGGTGGHAGASGSPAPSDACPHDPKKTEPGVCGCGIPDTDSTEAAGCSGLRAALRHRYSFGGSAKVVRDTIGMDDAVVQGTTLRGDGSLTLRSGEPVEYLALPGGLFAKLRDVTVELWLTLAAVSAPAQIFEFANSSVLPEGSSLFTLLLSQITAGERTTKVFYLATAGDREAHPHVGVLVPGMREISLDATVGLQVGAMTHLAVVADFGARRLRLFINGKLNAEAPLSISVSSLDDMYDWLGSSPNATDRNLSGSFHEFRIYDRALTPAQLAASFSAGPDPSFFAP